MSLLAAALRLVAAGLWVFPCRPGGKQPATAHGFKDAVSDPELARAAWTAMPDANVGVATGLSGLVVIDLDPPDGVDGWRALTAEHGAPRTLTVRTPRGGWHLWYRADLDRPVRGTTSHLAPHVDTRGVGGYVLAPPSVVAGRPYVWLPPTVDELPTVPPWVAGLLDQPKHPQRTVTPSVAAGPRRGTGYAEAALRGEVQAVLDAPIGTRNHALNRAAFALARLVDDGRLDRARVVAALELAGQQVGLGDREVQRTIASGLGAERRPA